MSSSDIGLQDTEPLSPDAARIRELMQRVRDLERFIVKQRGVLIAALELGRLLYAEANFDLVREHEALANAVKAYDDALQPKG